MADQRDEIAKALMYQDTTGGLSRRTSPLPPSQRPPELSAWLDKGGIYGQTAALFLTRTNSISRSRGPLSGSPGEVDWMQNLQPWQGGVAGGETTNPNAFYWAFTGGGGASPPTRAIGAIRAAAKATPPVRWAIFPASTPGAVAVLAVPAD